MKKNSFLIRFIDIGLILLFGFIVISDITIRSQIELPGSDPGEPQEDRQPHIVSLQVIDNDGFRLYDPQSETLLARYQSIENLETGLQIYKQQIRSEGKTLVALIELDDTTHMQTFINILDLCDKLGIAKNVNEETLRL